MDREMERRTNCWIVEMEDGLNVMYCEASAIYLKLKKYTVTFPVIAGYFSPIEALVTL